MVMMKGQQQQQIQTTFMMRQDQTIFTWPQQELLRDHDDQVMEYFQSFSDIQDSETQTPDDITYDSPPTLAQDCKSFKWNVQVIDTAGNIEGKMVSARDVWKLQNCKVIVQFDGDSGQPVEDSGGLLGSWLGQLSTDVNLLPIDYTEWRLVGDNTKNKVWDVIQAKFWFDNPTTRRKYVMSVLGSRCNSFKGRLWKNYKRDDRTETMQNRPNNVPESQWHNFVCLRFTENWKKMQERNTKNQKKNTMPHLCGRKSFGRKRREITIKTGKTPSRAEFFVATRTKSDGSFVSEEAKTRGEALTTLLTQNPSRQVTANVIASLDDEYAQVFGPERPGRIRCVGRGPTPSKLFGKTTQVTPEIENSEAYIRMKTNMKGLEETNKSMSMFIQQILAAQSGEQASIAWTKNFMAAFKNLANPTNSQETGDDTNRN
ncbi:uncharacterized protein LOC112086443 [Eutrema salsugineum]|uniref:uncharacterized protein LOC112086443 n=1 Tax=Eutrema salsugineum TaxID=72664 RepID=UPI000CED058D|nr:uncharacterized protein LOC112086443 [Eutrema salsugineum]